MTNIPIPSTDPLDQPLSFWESGALRSTLETEFSIVLMQQMQSRRIALDRNREKNLHDAVVPQAFERVAGQTFSLEQFRLMQADMGELLEKEWDRPA